MLKFKVSCAAVLCAISVNALADAPYIEHSTGFFAASMPLSKCLTTGQKAFSDLGLTLKNSTNPRNEVVGTVGDYKVVLYCVSEEGGCDAPEEPTASGGTVIAAGTDYSSVKSWVDKVKAKLKLQ
ncbi:MAG: hypothetical protein RI964_3185 [Pseudomonadota bacterium]|jgi:hypothetical protein